MRTNKKSRLLLPLLLVFLMTGCDKAELESLTFYYDYREVAVHGTALIGPKTGSGDYTLEIENPYVLFAEVQAGWSNPEGMIVIYGRLTGETWLTVTDNITKESQKLRIKVTDNYEILRLSQYSLNTPLKEHPTLGKIEFLFLVNNKARDAYFVNRENISLTDYVWKVRGKGTYTINTEDNHHYLTLSYPVDENGQLTDDGTKTSISNKFLITLSDFALHRLNQNLNLGFETTPSYPEEQRDMLIQMDEVDTEYKISGKLANDAEMPIGFL